MENVRRRAMAAALAGLAWPIACATSDRHAIDPSAADRAVAAYRTEQQLSAYALGAPSRCIDATSTTRQCVWQLGGRDPGWQAVSDAVGTRDRVNLICALPADGGERTDGSCAAYPQRSDRGAYRVAPERRGEPPKSEREVQLRDRARAELAAVHDLPGAIALVGDLPDQCLGEPAADHTCVWRLDSRTFGHGTVAASADVPLGKKVDLVCPFDADGRVRGGGICDVRSAE